MRYRHVFIAVLVAVCAISSDHQSAAQQCTSRSAQKYVELRENATREVFATLQNRIVGNAIGVDIGDNTTVITEEVLYDVLTKDLGVQPTNESRVSFNDALTTIRESHFQACYGSERVTLSNSQEIIAKLDANIDEFTRTRNQSLLATIRRLFGRYTCLLSLPQSPSISRRQATSTDSNCTCNNKIPLALKNYEMCLNCSIGPIFGLGPLVILNGVLVRSRRCVGFVVDDTGSMSEEIAAARQLILDFVNSEQDLPACYVLVSFNDKGLTPIVNNLNVRRVYDPSVLDSTSATSTLVVSGETVYSRNDLINDVNSLTANGGGDCPEYGMIGILEAINIILKVQGLVIPESGNLHHLIVLTDASPKDNNIYPNVINTAAEARVTVHFFYSGTAGCGGSFGNYDDVRIATGGIRVNNFADFDAFGTFIQLYNNAVEAGSSRRRKRQSTSSTNIFSGISECHNFETSLFSPSLTVLVRTTQSSVTVTRPDNTTHIITLQSGRTLGLYQDSNPQPGRWSACATPGTLEVAVTAPVILDLNVQFTETNQLGDIIPTSEVPRICSTGTIFVSTPQLPLISLNHSLYLDLVRPNSSIAESAKLTKCNGDFTGEIKFPEGLVFYQLRGHDLQSNPFAVTSDSDITFQLTSWLLQSISFNPLPVNPGSTSFHKLQLTYNEESGPLLSPTISSVSPNGVTTNSLMFPGLLPGENSIELLEINTPNSTLNHGDTFEVNFSIGDNCTSVAATITQQVTVYRPLPFSVVNTTLRNEHYLRVSWQPVDGLEIANYLLTIDYDNGSISTIRLGSEQLEHLSDAVKPYQRVFISLQALNANGSVLAFVAPKMFRSREGLPGPVNNIRTTSIFDNSTEIRFNQPNTTNGVITQYNIEVQVYESGAQFYHTNISANREKLVTVANLEPYKRYRVIITAETSVGVSEENEFVFYSKQGVPLSPPTNVTVRGLTKTSIIITWNPPSIADRRGFITTFNVMVSYTNVTGQTVTRTFMTKELALNVTNLPILPRVMVTVATLTEVGSGPASPLLTTNVELVPSAPRELTASIQSFAVILSWLPPEEENGVITQYKISSHNSSGAVEEELLIENVLTADEDKDEDDDQRVTTVINELSRDRTYFFSVAARTSVGFGPASNITTVDLAQYSATVTGVSVAIVIIVALAIIAAVSVIIIIVVLVKQNRVCGNKSNSKHIMMEDYHDTDSQKKE